MCRLPGARSLGGLLNQPPSTRETAALWHAAGAAAAPADLTQPLPQVLSPLGALIGPLGAAVSLHGTHGGAPTLRALLMAWMAPDDQGGKPKGAELQLL